jgi:NitT/TauT family transport system ATP-binding protein
MSTILQIEHLHKKYHSLNGEIYALEDISFFVSEGEFLSVVGPSGCGKSTLLSIISGLIPKTSGSVRILGKEA